MLSVVVLKKGNDAAVCVCEPKSPSVCSSGSGCPCAVVGPYAGTVPAALRSGTDRVYTLVSLARWKGTHGTPGTRDWGRGAVGDGRAIRELPARDLKLWSQKTFRLYFQKAFEGAAAQRLVQKV